MYDLDRVSQLLRSTVGFDVERFTWDAAGNLLDESHRTSDGRIAPLMDNLLRRYNGVQYVHDDWGQVIRRDRTKLTWDAEGHLLSSTTDQAHATYRCDALGRRIGKRVERFDVHGFAPESQVRETCFVWEGLRLAQERESTGITRTYVYDPVRAYAPVARVDRTIGDAQEKVWYYHTDPAGTARLVTDAQGRVVWSGSYAAWGKVRANLADTAAFVQPLRMPGQYHDEESGLHYNTFRFYDPHAGRFLSADPIGLAGGLNLYQYAPNPISWIDPLGLANNPLSGTPLGDILESASERTGKTYQGQQIFKITDKVSVDGIKFKLGDYYYLDGMHKDHIEAFSKNNRSKRVFNLDATLNEAKSAKAANRIGPGC